MEHDWQGNQSMRNSETFEWKTWCGLWTPFPRLSSRIKLKINERINERESILFVYLFYLQTVWATIMQGPLSTVSSNCFKRQTTKSVASVSFLPTLNSFFLQFIESILLLFLPAIVLLCVCLYGKTDITDTLNRGPQSSNQSSWPHHGQQTNNCHMSSSSSSQPHLSIAPFINTFTCCPRASLDPFSPTSDLPAPSSQILLLLLPTTISSRWTHLSEVTVRVLVTLHSLQILLLDQDVDAFLEGHTRDSLIKRFLERKKKGSLLNSP